MKTMKKKHIFPILAVWLGAVMWSVSTDSLISDFLTAVISLVLGLIVLSTASSTPELRRKYRPLGLILFVFGLVAAGLSIARKMFP